MTWRVVAASAIGTSHSSAGTDCQDSCYANVERDHSNSPLLVILVTDGAGSASCGRTGAELAIEAALAFVNEFVTRDEFALSDNWAVDCIQAVRQRIYQTADQHGKKARDYACTFLGVIATPFATLLMQIGDGGIVVDVGNGLEVPITPMMGEYANMTNFVTDMNAIDILKVAVLPDRADKVAVFSDGIQRLALNMASNTAHGPFFNPFFAVLGSATLEQEDMLINELVSFLSSPLVNERTDDDKTLALAHWIG